jgi:hypothetical protein
MSTTFDFFKTLYKTCIVNAKLNYLSTNNTVHTKKLNSSKIQKQKMFSFCRFGKKELSWFLF